MSLMGPTGELPGRDAVEREPVELQAFGRWLESLTPGDRVRAVRSLTRREQARLFDAASENGPLTLAQLVPPERGAWREVIHHGRNSLPLFSTFQKRFLRPEGGAAGDGGAPVLWGYNHMTGVLQRAGLIGYFTAREDAARGEVLIDYTRLPPHAPPASAGWPPLRANEAGLQRFVFAGMVDVLRRVSPHVTVGRAMRSGKVTDNWFVLCRED